MALDAVRALKLECPQEGGTQYDLGPTELSPLEDALIAAGLFVQNPAAPAADKLVLVDRTGTSLRLTDGTTSHVLGELVSSSPGQVGSHNVLADIIHFLPDGPGDGWPSGAVCDQAYDGPLQTSATWWTDATRKKRIIVLVNVFAGPLPQATKWFLFGPDGTTVVRTLTDTYSYSGPLCLGRTRTWGTT